MGTWGPGNLENDYALDELADRNHGLVASLLERARRKSSREGGDYDYTTLFVDFEVLFALDKAKLLVECTLPSPDEVEELKRDFLNDWDSNIDAIQPKPEFKKARRRTIVRTFSRFKRICQREATRRAEQESSLGHWVEIKPPPLKELLHGAALASHRVFEDLSISLPEYWKTHLSTELAAAPDHVLARRFMDTSSGRFVAPAKRIRKDSRSSSLEDHSFHVDAAFFATGRSLVPDIPSAADPYILLTRLRTVDAQNVPDVYDLAYGANEALSPFYQGEGEYVSSPYGIETPKELPFLGMVSFRKPPSDAPTDLYHHQNLYYHRASDESLLVLEYGVLGNDADDFPDQVLVDYLIESVRPARSGT